MFEYLLSGAFTGIVGAIVSRVGDYFTKKQDIEIIKIKCASEKELLEAQDRIMKTEWVGRNLVAATEGETARDVADGKSFQTSILSDAHIYANQKMVTAGQNWVMVILDFIRGFIRPALTAYLVILMSISYFMEVPEIKAQIVKTILSVTTTVVLWWFGTRSRDNKKK